MQLAAARVELEETTQRVTEALKATEENDGRDTFRSMYLAYVAATTEEKKRKRQIRMLECQEQKQRTIEEDANVLDDILADADALLKTAFVVIDRLPKKERASDRYEGHVSDIWGSAEELVRLLQ
jgi:hypothetical protein